MGNPDFVKNKINSILNNLYSMSEKERIDATAFALNLQMHHVDRVLKLANEAIEQSNGFRERLEKAEQDIEFYQAFIQNRNLGSEYEAYCREKGLIECQPLPQLTCPRCQSPNIRENVCLICAFPIKKGGAENARNQNR